MRDLRRPVGPRSLPCACRTVPPHGQVGKWMSQLTHRCVAPRLHYRGKFRKVPPISSPQEVEAAEALSEVPEGRGRDARCATYGDRKARVR